MNDGHLPPIFLKFDMSFFSISRPPDRAIPLTCILQHHGLSRTGANTTVSPKPTCNNMDPLGVGVGHVRGPAGPRHQPVLLQEPVLRGLTSSR